VGYYNLYQTYSQYDRVRVTNGDIYISRVDSNTNNTPETSTDEWEKVSKDGGRVTIETDGALSAGDTVLIQSDGTVMAVSGATALTTENFIGFAADDYSSGEDVDILVAGAVSEDQSSLTAGQKYYTQEDGTLGLAPDTTSVYAGIALSATNLLVKG